MCLDHEVELAILEPNGTWFSESVLVGVWDYVGYKTIPADEFDGVVEEAAVDLFLDKFDPPDEITAITMLYYRALERDEVDC